MPRKQAHILIIDQNLPVPFDRRVWQEATSLQRAGFGVTVICPKNKTYTKSREFLEGVEVRRYALLYEADSAAVGYLIEWLYCWLATLGIALQVYLRRPFQVIHACNPPDIFFALALLFRPLGVKFVFDHHDLCPEMYLAKGRPRESFLYRTLVMLERLTMRFADVIIAVNESHREIALKRGGVPVAKVVIVRSGPRRAWSDMNLPRPELKQDRKYLVMYLGEMCKQDGVDHLLLVIKSYLAEYPIDDTQFVLVGGGPDRERVQRMSEEMQLGPAVHFTGRIPDQDLWAYLSTADVCVDPDPLTEWSNLSTMTKILEYMAFGRPIVAFDLLEHRRSAGEAAVFVAAQDYAGFARAIRELLLDPGRRSMMSVLARQRFRQALAWENSEAELIAMYRKLLSVQPEVAEGVPSRVKPATADATATPAA